MPVLHCKPCNAKRMVKGIEDPSECRYCGGTMDYFDRVEVLEGLIKRSEGPGGDEGIGGKPASRDVNDRNPMPMPIATRIVEHDNALGQGEVLGNGVVVAPTGPRGRLVAFETYVNEPKGGLTHPDRVQYVSQYQNQPQTQLQTKDQDRNRNQSHTHGNSFGGNGSGSNQPLARQSIVQYAQNIDPGYRKHDGTAIASTDSRLTSQDRTRGSRDTSSDRRRERSPYDRICPPPRVRERSPLQSRGGSLEARERDHPDRDPPQPIIFGSRSLDLPVTPTGPKQDHPAQVASYRQTQLVKVNTGGPAVPKPAHEPPLPRPASAQPREATALDNWCLVHHTIEHVQGSAECDPKTSYIGPIAKGIRLTWINEVPARFGEQGGATSDAVGLFNQVYLAKQHLRGYKQFWINRDFIFETVLKSLRPRLSKTVVAQFMHFMGRANSLSHHYICKSDLCLEEHINRLAKGLRERPELSNMRKQLKTTPDRSSLLEGLFWLDSNNTPFRNRKSTVKALRNTMSGISLAYREGKISLASEVRIYLDRNTEISSNLRSAWIESVFRSTYEAQPHIAPACALDPLALQVTEWPSLQDTAKECINGKGLPEHAADVEKYRLKDPNITGPKPKQDNRNTQTKKVPITKAGRPARKVNVIKSEVKTEDGN